MTRRERLENKLERRSEWADKAHKRASEHFQTTERLVEHIPLGQPILVGHHSEKRHRKVMDRVDSHMHRGVEESKLAKYHEQKASGLASQLKHTVFSDDENAIEALQERIRKNEEKRDLYKRINAAWKKNGEEGVRALGFGDAMSKTIQETIAACPWEPKPFAPWQTTNIGARIRADKERIEQIKRQQTKHEEAEAAGGIVIKGEGYVSITFAEKPAREILNALRAAGFYWSSGSWHGSREKIPSEINALGGEV